MLSRSQLSVLSACVDIERATQREVAHRADLSLGATNRAISELRGRGLLTPALTPTPAGLTALGPYRVKTAVILAAGASTRFAPLSFEKPKALFTVRGEVLIERLIRQLREAGIKSIRVVVGHMKEQFYYLEEQFGVQIIENPAYLERNNHASLKLALDHLGESTYVCSSDQYYPQNLFNRYEFASYCTAVYFPAAQGEEAIKIGARGRITGFSNAPQAHSWCLLGPTFLDATTVKQLYPLLENASDRSDMREKLWEQIMGEHLDELSIYARKREMGDIYEFDYLDDLCAFDTDFLENVDSSILDNICATLSCERSDITHVEPLKEGLTNLSVLFDCKGERYVYRHPGAGTNEVVNRTAEKQALETAVQLGLDTTYIHEDSQSGWKISRFIPDCVPFDYHNCQHVTNALALIRRLHTSGATSSYHFDFYDEALKIVALLEAKRWRKPQDFDKNAALIACLVEPMRQGAGKSVFCHNDFYGPNILVQPNGKLCLIDWEYAAMGDYGCDIGNFVAQGSGYTVEEAYKILPLYFSRTPTDAEVFHCMACIAIVGWYWYVWAIYKECMGAPVGSWLGVWYKAAKGFGTHALKLLSQREAVDLSLSREEFDALVLAEAGSSLDDADPAALRSLVNRKLINEGAITPAGITALEPYRARRAVFFAAGFGSRMLPITINTPKPLVRVHGVRIIDRLLDAVISAGITEIYVVRGYLKEAFDQLLTKYPTITFIDNPLYDCTNNISSAVAAREHFQNAYVFESDLLLANPSYITKYQYRSHYLAIPVDATPDWYFDADENDKIVHLAKGKNSPCWQMVGLSYWSAKDGANLAEDIQKVFERGGDYQQIFWDDVAIEHKPEHYDVYVQPCTPQDVVEIDSFAELQEVDPAYRID